MSSHAHGRGRTTGTTKATETEPGTPEDYGKPKPGYDAFEPGMLGDDNPLARAHEVGYLGTTPDDDTDYTVEGVTKGAKAANPK